VIYKLLTGYDHLFSSYRYDARSQPVLLSKEQCATHGILELYDARVQLPQLTEVCAFTLGL
jgi:hypothetical protein